MYLHGNQDPVINIKVLLKKESLNVDTTFTFESDDGLMLSYSQEPQKKYFFKKNINVHIHHKKVIINNKKNKSPILRITPIDGHISFDSNNYLGAFYLHVNGDDIEIINKLPLEDYTDSVVRTEGWPGWPLETYKVFAITCRTYGIYQLQQARRKKLIYHVKPTNAHQTYFGTHSCQIIKDAVNQTAGIFLAYKNKPILAMFDSCCGGIIPGKMSNGVNFKEAPYLARSYPCTYCKNLKIFEWQKDFSIKKLKKILQPTIPQLKNISDIKTKTDPSGKVQKVIIIDKTTQFTIDGKKLYSLLLPDLKSSVFTCTKKRNIVSFKGKGYGHHLGLCQWGANELVKQGWPYQKILHFYYPGTHLMKLKPKEPKR